MKKIIFLLLIPFYTSEIVPLSQSSLIAHNDFNQLLKIIHKEQKSIENLYYSFNDNLDIQSSSNGFILSLLGINGLSGLFLIFSFFKYLFFKKIEDILVFINFITGGLFFFIIPIILSIYYSKGIKKFNNKNKNILLLKNSYYKKNTIIIFNIVSYGISIILLFMATFFILIKRKTSNKKIKTMKEEIIIKNKIIQELISTNNSITEWQDRINKLMEKIEKIEEKLLFFYLGIFFIIFFYGINFILWIASNKKKQTLINLINKAITVNNIQIKGLSKENKKSPKVYTAIDNDKNIILELNKIPEAIKNL